LDTLTTKYDFASPKALKGASLQRAKCRNLQSAKKGGVFPRARARKSAKGLYKKSKETKRNLNS